MLSELEVLKGVIFLILFGSGRLDSVWEAANDLTVP
jgi:hypothetical protein